MSWLHAARTRARLLFGARAAEERMNEEIGFHVDMEAERLEREEGLDPVEARRRARVAFGGVEGHKEAMREGRGLAWLGGMKLDLKLGVRMLVKYPGLTIVGGIAMAFAIWAGTVTFVMVGLFVNPSLPLPGGDRVVRIANWDLSTNNTEERALSDFAVWRSGLRSVTDLGAYRDVSRNLLVGGDVGTPVTVAEITSSAFRIAPERPLLGRVLTAEDERPGSPPVVVLGYDVWRSRFAGDPTVVGRNVRLGDAYATVVGVMPEGFAFPIAHEVWTPLRLDAASFGPLEGPSIEVFGRLAPGVTFEGAQAELTTVGRRAAVEHPETHGRLQPRIQPYAEMLIPIDGGEDVYFMILIEVFAVMLLVLICSNVALLLFARAASRENELVVRSALGASRGRIVAQLFAEALVLGTVSAAVGLAAAYFALGRWGLPFLEMNMGAVPFWFDPRISLETVLYAGALTLLAAVIVGVLPGLKITRGIGSRLKTGTGGGGGPQFGGVWTAVIVAQVAVTVAFPAVVLVEVKELNRIRSFDFGFAAEEYLGVQLAMDDVAGADAGLDSAASAAAAVRFGTVLETLRQRVAAEPGVQGVSFVDRLPSANYGDYHFELDDAPVAAGSGAEGAPAPLTWTAIANVDPSYFEVLGAPILAGRGFQPADLAPDARVVIADQGFVERALLGRNPIGRRVRILNWTGPDTPPTPGPWYHIIGVVKELGSSGAAEQSQSAGLYRPGVPGRDFSPHMVIHTRGEPVSMVPRLRAIGGGVEPTLRLSEIQRIDQATSPLLWFIGLWLRTTLVVTGLALVLSLAGIYAVLSFTVVRRTREIGVRVALGANPRRVLAAVFRRPLTQVGIGVMTGAALIGLGAVAMFQTTQFKDGSISLAQVGLLVAYAAFMLGVCLLACVIPTWRVLRVQPMEALRAE